MKPTRNLIAELVFLAALLLTLLTIIKRVGDIQGRMTVLEIWMSPAEQSEPLEVEKVGVRMI